jgi:hypothetical protein
MHDTFKSRFCFSDDMINCRKIKTIRIQNWHILSQQIFFINFFRHFRGHNWDNVSYIRMKVIDKALIKDAVLLTVGCTIFPCIYS